MVRANSNRMARTSTDPRWKRYGIHWHMFVARHLLTDKGRSAGFVDEQYRSATPKAVLTSPPDVVGWQRQEITRALRDAKEPWKDGSRQGLDDLSDSGDWGKALRAQLEKGMSSFQVVRVSDSEVVDITAYAISAKDCDQH